MTEQRQGSDETLEERSKTPHCCHGNPWSQGHTHGGAKAYDGCCGHGFDVAPAHSIPSGR